MNRKWSVFEEQFIIENAAKLSDEDACSQLNAITGKNHTVAAYRKKRASLGITKSKGAGVCEVERETSPEFYWRGGCR